MSVTLHTKTGPIKIELILKNEAQAKHVHNFLRHCAKESYNDNKILRFIPKFILQSGDPSNSGKESNPADVNHPIDKLVKSHELRISEESAFEIKRGSVLTVNNLDMVDKLGSQFFICLSDEYKSSLIEEERYTVIGNVIDGLEAVETIEKDPELNNEEKMKKNGKPKRKMEKRNLDKRS
ncbi:hypothetical protein QCA50_018629 [Cerrena zonata]|uniref:Peptidyl-prolyl cis-trans isomerase-like 3 n=1 Tax=Cerrena zonata TaxID=2478898 RepID=A0AAW0FD45_9APHY